MDILDFVAGSRGFLTINLQAILILIRFMRGKETPRGTYEVRKQTQATQGVNGGLCRFCLLLSVHIWDERHVNQSKVFVSNTELELPHCLDERGGLDITHGASELQRASDRKCIMSTRVAYLYDANIGLLASVVDRNLRDAFYPILDSIRNMGNDLTGAVRLGYFYRRINIPGRSFPGNLHVSVVANVIRAAHGDTGVPRTSFSMT